MLLEDSDNQYVMIDSTIVRAQLQAATGRGAGPGSGAFPGRVEHQDSNGVGRTGTVSAFSFTGGQAADPPQGILLLSEIQTGCVISE